MVGEQYRAVVVHGVADARLALSFGLPLSLLSAPGAALFGGCGWWMALVREARAAWPAVPAADILDCGESAGQALAALRIGQRRIVLAAMAPGWDAVRAIAARQGSQVLAAPPPAYDMRGFPCGLLDWLRTGSGTADLRPA